MMMSGMLKSSHLLVRTLLLLLPMLCLVSCGNDETEEKIQLEAPRMTGSIPADGATGVASGELSIGLTFDQNVTTPAVGHHLVSVAGASVAKVSSNLTQVTILITGLEAGKTYQLVIPEDVILGPTKVSAQEIRIGFSTITEPQPGEISSVLCTSEPMAETQKVYDYLVEVYGSKVLSGTMADVNWNVAEAQQVYKATGKYPAITFFDYIHLYASPANWIDYSNTQVAEDWWSAGGLIGAGWHWMVPVAENAAADQVTYKPVETTFRASKALTEGTWENRIMKADLEKMAGYLKLLQEKKIPVIWRPLHEAAGNIYEFAGGTAWFWWGADGAEVYKKLWIYMFDYFKEAGINNLIWVWTTQLKDDSFYPGDEYVDMIGRDIYNQQDGMANASQFTAIGKTYSNKPVALSECGDVSAISNQWNAGGKWSFFMPWYDYDVNNNGKPFDDHMYAGTAWWKDAMNHDSVISRDELPSFKQN